MLGSRTPKSEKKEVKWVCQYHNPKGLQCREPAFIRLIFSSEHPFDHMDLCGVHQEDYPVYKSFQYIMNNGEELDGIIYVRP